MAEQYVAESYSGRVKYRCARKGCTYSTERHGRMSRHLEEAHGQFVHVPEADPEEAAAAADGAAEGDGSLLAGNMAAVKARVSETADVEALEAALAAESGEAKPRKGVVEAIEARIAELRQ